MYPNPSKVICTISNVANPLYEEPNIHTRHQVNTLYPYNDRLKHLNVLPTTHRVFWSMIRLWISIWVCTCIPRNTVAKLVHRHRLWLWDVPYNNLVTLLMSFLVQCLVFWMQWTWGCLDGTWTSGLWLYLLCVVLFSSCASSCMVRIHGFELSLLVY